MSSIKRAIEEFVESKIGEVFPLQTRWQMQERLWDAIGIQDNPACAEFYAWIDSQQQTIEEN